MLAELAAAPSLLGESASGDGQKETEAGNLFCTTWLALLFKALLQASPLLPASLPRALGGEVFSFVHANLLGARSLESRAPQTTSQAGTLASA